jgi:hypothetical protein
LRGSVRGDSTLGASVVGCSWREVKGGVTGRWYCESPLRPDALLVLDSKPVAMTVI